jgi:hypothetical protein
MQESQTVDSPLPPALLRSPRMVHRKPGTLGPLLLGRILTAPVLAVCAALLGLVILESIVVFLVPAQPARVVALSRDSKARGASRYYIEYQFDGSGFTVRDEVLPAEYQAFQVGQAVKAHVIHLGPLGYSALDRSPGAYAHYRMILWVGTLFALVIGGVLFYAIWLLPSRSRWLARHGEATFGTVVDKNLLGCGGCCGRRRSSCTLTYRFNSQGTPRARRILISPQRYDSAGVKDQVIVLFDPARPSRNIVYDYCDFIAS